MARRGVSHPALAIGIPISIFVESSSSRQSEITIVKASLAFI